MFMRYLILSITLVAFIPHLHAQNTAFGLKAGLNLSTLNVQDPAATYNSKTGFHGGFFVRERFENIALQPELLLYTQNGEVENTTFGKAQESFTYLTIPIMIKFYPFGGLNLQLGPQFGFLLDGERKYDTFLGSGTEDIKDHYKSSDVSVSFGGGYDFGFGLNLDARYNLGIKDINNAANGEPVKSRVFMISLGWNFLGGGE
jgi:hypothetical protein